MSKEENYYIISESKFHITALLKDKLNHWVYTTSYYDYRKGNRKVLTEDEAQKIIKEVK